MLRIDQSDLNTKRMMDLMAVNQDDGPIPLYLHIVSRILRDMRANQQTTGHAFSYGEFKSRLLSEGLTSAQLVPLNQRLDTLESFMSSVQTEMPRKNGKKAVDKSGTDWTSKVCGSKRASYRISDKCSRVILQSLISHVHVSLLKTPALFSVFA